MLVYQQLTITQTRKTARSKQESLIFQPPIHGKVGFLLRRISPNCSSIAIGYAIIAETCTVLMYLYVFVQSGLSVC